jgi:hypothetical protein
LLEELNLNFPIISSKCDLVIRNDHQVLSLPQLRKINLSGDRMDRQFLNDVWKISEPFEDDIITYTDDIETVPVLVTFNYWYRNQSLYFWFQLYFCKWHLNWIYV